MRFHCIYFPTGNPCSFPIFCLSSRKRKEKKTYSFLNWFPSASYIVFLLPRTFSCDAFILIDSLQIYYKTPAVKATKNTNA